jgi:tight adherence protein C
MIEPALTGLAGACCAAVGIRGVALIRSPSAIERRELRAVESTPDRSRGPTRRLVDLLGRRLGPLLEARMSPRRRAAIQQRLDRAGRPGGMDVSRYAEIQAAAFVILGLIAVLFIASGSWFGAVITLLASWMLPELWLRRRARHRQERLERDLPDFVDILAVTVRAGIGYRASLERVARSLHGPAGEEVFRALREMDLGATRREAFEALRSRNASATLDSFVAAQLQAEELGVPLADALASIAADTRRAAAQHARRRAQRMTPRITFVVIGTMLPATLLLIIAGMLIGSGVSFSHLGL